MGFRLPDYYKELTGARYDTARSFDYKDFTSFLLLADLLEDEGKEDKAMEVRAAHRLTKLLKEQKWIDPKHPYELYYRGNIYHVTMSMLSNLRYRLTVRDPRQKRWAARVCWNRYSETSPYVKMQKVLRAIDEAIVWWSKN